jgi:4-hydroxythreonine-4-phosphate dehydrogenase
MGDVNGIGPEITVRFLRDAGLLAQCRPLIVGSYDALMRYADDGNSVGSGVALSESDVGSAWEEGRVGVLEPSGVPLPKVEPAKVAADAGKFAFACVELAVRLALDGHVDAIVTCPVNKKAVHLGGYQYAGHTEFLAELCGCDDYRMMLVADELRVVHVTTHVALKHVVEHITTERVAGTIRLADQAMKRLGTPHARIAVAALNPHAGEDGLFGSEERDEIAPAIEMVRGKGADVTGPVPADTAFTRMANGDFDVVVAMYHDQGHIPLKLAGFKRAVNITLGLPIIRTSVGHGTAFDIVGKGVADSGSLIEAVRLAAVMAA